VISAGDLLQWLRVELRREDVAAFLEQLLADPALDDDFRLLHFAIQFWPEMPGIWRGRPLDPDNIVAAAGAALAGSAPDAQWLESLSDGRVFDFYDRNDRSSLAEAGRDWLARRDRYNQTWETLLGLGAPGQARPPPSDALAITALLAYSEQHRVNLRNRASTMLGPSEWLRRALWFLHFGSSLDELSDEQVEVLEHLQESSLLNDLVVAQLDDLGELTPERLQTLRSGLIISTFQQSLIRKLTLVPGAEIVTLQAGQHYEPDEARTLSRAIARGVGAILRPLGHWVAQEISNAFRRRNALGSATTPPPLPELRLEVRMVRVQVEVDIPTAAPIAWLARVAWDAPEDSSSRVVIKQLALPFELPRLKTQLLPARGQFMTLFFDSSSLRLVRRLGRWRRHASNPIEIWFGPQPSMIKCLHSSMMMLDKFGFVGSLTSPTSKLFSIKGHLTVLRHALVSCLADMKLVDASGMLAAILHMRAVADGRWSWARLTTPREQKIFRFLMSPTVGTPRRDQ